MAKSITGKANPDAYPELTDYSAVALAEGFEEPVSDEHYVAAWQYLVDKGLAWSLQGWFGRRAKQLIDAGVIHA